MISNVKSTPEYDNFKAALSKVLKVSHADMKAQLEAEKAAKAAKKSPKR